MDEGCPWMVVLRAYMICLRCMWGSVSTAPPDYFIVLPQARRGNGRAGVTGRDIRRRADKSRAVRRGDLSGPVARTQVNGGVREHSRLEEYARGG
jgi:hypothetical protein